MGAFRGTELTGVVVETERLVLRPWRPRDADAVAAALSDPAMHAFLALPSPYTPASALAYVTGEATVERTAGTGLECAVIERSSGALVGSATLRLPVRMRPADIGYWIAPGAQRRGYAAESAAGLARWAFAHGVYRVSLCLDVRNLASARVALRAGFGFEGVRREAYALDPTAERHDLAVFVRTATDAGTPVPPAFPALPDGGLTDGTLTLRVPRPGDLDAVLEQESDPVTMRVGFGGAEPRDVVRRKLERAELDHLTGSRTVLAMVDASSSAFGGMIRLRAGGPPGVGGIGYAVHPAYRGRGFTTRALRLLCPWAFAAGFARLELGAKVDNLASQRAALSAGFQPDGIMRHRLRNPDGGYSDEARFFLLVPES